jgi:hypothetical protein
LPTLSAREVLDGRVASGEITAEQSDQLRHKLDANSAPGSDQQSHPARAAG